MANIDITHSKWYYLPAITKGGVMFYIDMEEMLTESLDLKKQIAALKKELRSIPEETLLSYAKGGKRYYLSACKDKYGKYKRHYIPISNIERIGALARRKYLLKLLPLMEKEYETLAAFLDDYDPNAKYSAAKCLDEKTSELVSVLADPLEQEKRWLSVGATADAFLSDNLRYETLKGDLVRSKSEVIIADSLYNAGIAYKYEHPLVLGGKTYYPDFTVRRRRDGRIFYWEHLGGMDDPDYVTRSLRKLSSYAQYGLVCGNDLLITWESEAVTFQRSTVQKYLELFR